MHLMNYGYLLYDIQLFRHLYNKCISTTVDKGSIITRVHRMCVMVYDSQGAVSIRKTVLPGMAIPMLKIRRPNGRLIFNMEIAIRR